MSTAMSVPSPDETEILALLASLRRAHHEKNAVAIAAAYDKDAFICDLSPPLSHHGIDVKAKQAWLDGWDGPIELETPPGTLCVSGDLAVHYGYTRLSGKPQMAPHPISFWLRDTIVLNRTRGEWKIAHIHSSVPFTMDGAPRPAFDLHP